MKRFAALLLSCLLLAGCGRRENMPSAAPSEKPEISTEPSVPRELGYCLALAQDMERRYGAKILIGEAAAARTPWDYEFTPEPLAAPAYRQLQALDRSLANFPKTMLDSLFSPSVTICLVGAISGVPGTGSVKRANGLQFSDDNGVTVALAAGPNGDRALYHELYHLMEPQLSLENWDALNPAGFAYQNSRTAPRDSSLAQGENRAFIDTYSMSYAKEDRARIFEHAMTAENGELFQSDILQKKLHVLCAAIREAYALEDGAYLWEQYLDK